MVCLYFMIIFRDALPDGKSGDFVIVQKSQLFQLFQRCPTCLTSNVLHEIKTSGTHISVITKCDEHENRWESQDCWHAGEQPSNSCCSYWKREPFHESSLK